MSRITGRSTVAPLGMFQQATSASTGTGSVDASFSTYIGQKFDTSDGRELVLASNGTVALVSGVLVQATAEVTAFQKLAMTVPATYPATAGLTQIYVTNGSTVLNVNQYAGGYLVVDSGTGIGQTLKIASHQAAANGAKFIVNTEDKIQVTLDATSTISLFYNPYQRIVIAPYTSQTNGVVGASLYPVAASTANTYNATTGALTATGVEQYALIVTKGATGVLADNSSMSVGYPIGRSAATNGAFGVATLTTSAAIGTVLQTPTSAHTALVYLNL